MIKKKHILLIGMAFVPLCGFADIVEQPHEVIADSVASVDAAQIDSMASHYLRMAIEDEKKNESSIFAFDDPERQKKHPWKAAIETFGINVLVQSFDRFILDADFAQISFNSIKHNIKNGFVWDNDQFSTNLFAHPYHGGLYFNAARSNGMNFGSRYPIPSAVL